jgi:hypothetical protein
LSNGDQDRKQRFDYQCTVDESSSARSICSLIPVRLMSLIPPAWKLGLNCPCLRLDMASTAHCAIVLPEQTTESREVHKCGGRKGDAVLYPIRSRAIISARSEQRCRLESAGNSQLFDRLHSDTITHPPFISYVGIFLRSYDTSSKSPISKMCHRCSVGPVWQKESRIIDGII